VVAQFVVYRGIRVKEATKSQRQFSHGSGSLGLHGVSPWRTRFDTRPVHMVFLVRKVALRCSSRHLSSPTSVPFHQSSICHWSCLILRFDSVDE